MTLAILVLAFGSLVAAGLPLMLTILGLVAVRRLAVPRHPAARHLDLGDELRADVRARARHRLRAVHRHPLPRRALRLASCPPRTRSRRRWTPPARPCCSRGVTVLISLTAVMLVPSPAFRSMALGIMLSVVFILAATLTLLPAVLGQARPAGRQARAAVGALRRAPLAALRRLGRAALAAPARLRRRRARRPARARRPGARARDRHAVDQGRARRRRLARRATTQVQQAFGAGAPGRAADRRAAQRRRRARSAALAKADPGIAAVTARRSPARGGSRWSRRSRNGDPSDQAVGAHDRPAARASCPPGALVGGAAAENHDLEAALSAKTPLVIGVVLALGFLLLLVALQAPLIAAVGVLTNLLATGAAFGVAQADLPGRPPAPACSASSRRASSTPGAPVFFFAMIFAISMDYTVFLLSSAKEHWDRTSDPREAMVGGVAHSGRVDLRRRRGDGRRLLHLRALRPAAAQGDGRHPRHRRPARRRCWCGCCSCRCCCGCSAAGLVAAPLARPRSCPTSASATPERERGPRPIGQAHPPDTRARSRLASADDLDHRRRQ